MSKYQCRECKEESEGPFPGGQCSKCGSINIRNLDHKRVRKKSEKDTDFKKTFLMILLWGYIIYEIVKRTG